MRSIPFLIHGNFEQTARRFPKNIAIRFEDNEISYAELELLSSRIANELVNRGAKPGMLIGISVDRSFEMVASLIAILKVGCGYLPLDPSYPKERLLYMVEDSQIEMLIANSYYFEIFQTSNKVKLLDVAKLSKGVKNEFKSYREDSLVYVIYTSGSTGDPKGVALTHSGLESLIEWISESTRSSVCDKTLQFSPLSFDPSFMEIFSTLLTGKTLVLIDQERRKDPQILLDLIIDENIERIFVPIVILNALAEEAINQDRFPLNLKEVNCGGDTMKINHDIITFFERINSAHLNNQYGPTEAAIMVTNHNQKGDPKEWSELPPLGSPIKNVEIKIFDENRNELKENNIGEIYIAGSCLAQGYWKKEKLTHDRFISIKKDDVTTRFYRTGDLGEFNTDGNLLFHGRIDDQVKVNGIRIELGEVEAAAIELAHVTDCSATVYEEEGIKRFVLYYVGDVNFENVKTHLQKRLPATMLPHFVEQLSALPLTSNGKVDKKKLPKPIIKKERRVPVETSDLDKKLVSLWEKVLKIEGISVDDNFFDVGGNSLLAMKIISKLRKDFEFQISVAAFFQYPNIRKLSEFMLGETDQVKHKRKSNTSKRKVAVIGMSAKFPGADSIDKYWEMILNKEDGISFFSDDELDKTVTAQQKIDPNYVKARGYLPNIDLFDSSFFGINPRVGELMDPQLRFILEYAYLALENSGTAVTKTDSKIGVFAGMSNNTYYINNVIHHQDKINSVGEWTVATFNEKDYVATQIAHKLGLTGPALSIHSGCSTSLVAIAQAIRSIENGDCDMALAGGVNVDANSKTGYLYQEGNIRSKDGLCRPFDHKSSGTIFCDGVGVVVLKDYEEAIKDGDQVYAIVKGVGVNNDGNDKMSFTAPSVNGQKDVIDMALADQGVDPKDIELVEAHGTATPVGDPIELEALTQAWNVRDHHAVIGSVKGNIGHTIGAAGVAGFIKATLALHHKILPATNHYEAPNPKIDFNVTPFEVLTKTKNWESNKKRHAAVSAFGVGGTNAHIILAEADQVDQNEQEKNVVAIPLSAKSLYSIKKSIEQLIEFIARNKEINLSNLAFTLQNGRVDYKHRACVYASSRKELIDNLSSVSVEKVNNFEILFAFPGQGSQYLGMGYSLYKEYDAYRDSVDECANILNTVLDCDIRDVIFHRNDEVALKDTYYTQPAIFVTEYALARLFQSFGIKPHAMIGHSVGEFAAAVISEIMSLKDAALMIAKRAELMRDLPRGCMLSVRADVESLEEFLDDNVQLAAINGPQLCVLAGSEDAINKCMIKLDRKDIQSKKLHTSHAFHSDMMRPIVDEFFRFIEQFSLSNPKISIFSTVTNGWVKDEMSSSTYWANHVIESVKYNSAIKSLTQASKQYNLIELGPRNTLSILALQQLRVSKDEWKCVDALGSKSGNVELSHFRKCIGRLWGLGVLKRLGDPLEAKKISLPAYPFEQRSLWLPQEEIAVSNNQINVQISNQQRTTKKGPSMEIMIVNELKKIIEEASGFGQDELVSNLSFMELGFDSLLLTQVALDISKHFECNLTFRQMMDEVPTIDTLAAYIKANSSESVLSKFTSPKVMNTQSVAESIPSIQSDARYIPASDGSMEDIINQQLEIMRQQVQLLTGQATPRTMDNVVKPVPTVITKPKVSLKDDIDTVKATVNTAKTAFGAQARISTDKEEADQLISSNIEQFIGQYVEKTRKSKEFTQKYRAANSDPRVVTGFRPEIKEIIYPLVVNRSKDQHLWDIDGNEYVDMICGFGSNFFGNQNQRINKALHYQLDQGFEIGPQHELVGECADLICEFTGQERAAFCNTGSEAVLGAIRTARAISGKSKVVMFKGSYHGINDEVIVRGLSGGRAMPAAAGINKSAVSDLIILDYGTDESYQFIEKEIGNIAAVITESVQSRRPNFRPVEFLKKVRELTANHEVALIFDEVITGFRIAPGGAQEYYGIKADLATYGKIVGAGMPIGVIAGVSKYMDALDGGQWQYGDDSMPTVGVTYFAGTFVRHPLALRAMREALLILKEAGTDFYDYINSRSAAFVNEINSYCELTGAPIKIDHFGGVLKPKFTSTAKNNDLFYAYMRYNGVHVWDGFPWFITMAHSEEDLQFVTSMIKKSISQMQSTKLFPVSNIGSNAGKNNFLTPPIPNAKIGRDENGNPAWFIEDEENPGQFLQVSEE